MATLEQLSAALVNADRAGDVDAARTLAGEITKLRQAPVSAGAPVTPAQADPYREAALSERQSLNDKGINTSPGMTRNLFQGATLGFGDELIAGMTTPLEMIRRGTLNPAEGYKYAKARENLVLDDARENNGIAGTVAEGVGGVVTGGGLAKAGLSLAGRVAPNANLLTKIAAGVGEGAAYGGVYGAGEGEGVGGRVIGGVQGAALGGAVGGAFPLFSQGILSGYKALSNSRAANEISKQTGVEPEVMRMLGNTLEADGTLGARGVANMQRAGADAMLADAGPNARAVLDTAIQRGGPGAVQARDAIAARTQRGAREITNTLDQTFGTPEGITATQTVIRRGSAPARSAAYDAAYAQPINYADDAGRAIEELVKTRVPGSAISDANKLMALEGHQSKQILAKIGDDGTVVFDKLPDVRQIDYITRALNQAAQSGDGAGALGGQTPLGRAYQNLSGEIRDTLRNAVPEYDIALKTAADPIQRSKAVEFGGKLLMPSVTRDKAAEIITGMTGAERTALSQGIRSKIDDTLAQVSRTVQDGDAVSREAIKGLRDLSTRANRDKIRLAIGGPESEKLFQDLDRVAMSFDLRASVAENSKTFARQATSKKIGEMTQPGPVGKLMQGEPINAGRQLAQMLTGKTPEKITAREDALYSQIADLLTRPRADAANLFKGIYDLNNAGAKTQVTANDLARLLTGAQSAAYPTASLAIDKRLSR